MFSNDIEEQDLIPWQGLTLTCVRILQLYWKVFQQQDLQEYLRIKEKTCKNCKCSRDGHEVVAEHGARSRLGYVTTHDGLDARSLGYTFVPPGLSSARQVDQYYSTLPSEEVPKLGSKGEMNRSQRIVRQLPKQDLALSACKFVEPEYSASYKDFIDGRNQVALDVAMAKPTPPNSTCAHCSKIIPSQQISVAAPRLGKSVWHPSCFRCTTCDDLLVDLAYCVYEDNIYCERHYAEKMKPRCAGCDEPVHDNESQNTDEDSDTPSLAPQNAGPSRSSITPAPFAPPPKRVRKVGHLAKQNELLSMACTYLREAKEPPQDDVCAVTKVWSEKLQTLEHQQRLFAEKAINDILFEATMGNLHRYSVRINEDFYPQRNASVQSFSSTSQSVASSLPSPTEAEEELPQLSTFYTTFTPL